MSEKVTKTEVPIIDHVRRQERRLSRTEIEDAIRTLIWWTDNRNLPEGNNMRISSDYIREHVFPAIAQLLKQTEWIPVAERLPEIQETVLFYAQFREHEGFPLTRVVHLGHRTSDGWFPHDDDGYYATDKVTHWMPVPPGPEEDDKR